MKTFKKIALVVAAVLVFCGSVSAKPIRFGVKAGMNVNSLHFNNNFANSLKSKDNSAGWEAGLMTEFTVPLIGIGVDLSLMYARMNNNTQDYTASGLEFDGKSAGKNFLMIPLNLKYKVSLPLVGKYIAPYIFTGPNFLIKLDKDVLNYLKTKTCQVAWNVGLGVELIQHLQVGAAYNFGINNILKKTDLVNASDLNVKNNYWTVTAAWLF